MRQTKSRWATLANTWAHIKSILSWRKDGKSWHLKVHRSARSGQIQVCHDLAFNRQALISTLVKAYHRSWQLSIQSMVKQWNYIRQPDGRDWARYDLAGRYLWAQITRRWLNCQTIQNGFRCSRGHQSLSRCQIYRLLKSARPQALGIRANRLLSLQWGHCRWNDRLYWQDQCNDCLVSSCLSRVDQSSSRLCPPRYSLHGRLDHFNCCLFDSLALLLCRCSLLRHSVRALKAHS